VAGGIPVSTREGLRIGDRYELEALIGRGGIGEVWRARHVALNSRVAVKFLQLHKSEHEDNAVKKRRFTTEAQITAQLKTPHAVQVFDFGVTNWDQPYLVMELLEGETLGRRLERVKRIGAHETVHLLGQAARALHRAHQLGIVHRDFKPDNVVVCVDDEGRDYVKVLDFGVAKLVGALEADADASDAPDSSFSASFTRTGSVVGTPLYMAPEQVRGAADVDARVDLWAFGVVAFECLTGRPPFSGADIDELFGRILRGEHPSAHFLEETVPESFDAWFGVACAADPAKRFMNASIAWKQLANALNVETNVSGSDLSLSSGERPLPVLFPKGVDVIGAIDDDMTLKDDTILKDDAILGDGTLKRVIGRTSTGDFSSIRRMPLRSDAAAIPPAAPSSGHATSPLARSNPEEPKRGASTRVWVGLGGALVVLAGLAVWRASAGPGNIAPAASSSPAAATPGEAPVAPVASTVALGAATPSSAATGPASSPQVTEPVTSADRHAAPPSSVTPMGRGAWRPAPVASHAVAPAPATASAIPSAQVVATTVPAPTQPPPPPSPALSSLLPARDPLSERQ
jgi:serine/threonine-protein kinase